jgi:hypothetical protein
MEIVNLSSEPIGRLHSWLPQALAAEKVVFLPDACGQAKVSDRGQAKVSGTVNVSVPDTFSSSRAVPGSPTRHATATEGLLGSLNLARSDGRNVCLRPDG